MSKKPTVQSSNKSPAKKFANGERVRKTIGSSFVQGMLDTKKIKIENIEVSKKTYEQLENFAEGFTPPLSIELAVSRILKEFLED
jgi:hypothetical protein